MGTGASQHDEATVWSKRDEYLGMDLAEKRSHYPGNFVPLNHIKPWPEYFMDDVSVSERDSNNTHPPHDIINSKVSLYQGDITQLEIDAIVNSAARPEQGGQVNMAILEQAGEYYQSECILNGLGSPGEAMLTGGYCLPARYVFNTLAPKKREEHILRKCYTSCLDLAKYSEIKTVAFPCIATRKVRGFKIEKATEIALDTTRRWLDLHHSRIERVIFCVYDERGISTYKRLMQKYFPVRGYCSSQEQYEPQELYQSDESEHDSANETGLNLEDWRDTTFQRGIQEITMRRGDSVKMIKQLHSIYTDVDNTQLCCEPVIHFEGEDGIDDGGLSKEYFFEALDILTHTTIQGSALFEGPTDHMLPCPSKVHLNAGLFYTTGKVLAHSVLHYGMGLFGLSRAIVYLLTHKLTKDEVEYSGVPVTIDDVIDTDMKYLLQKDSVSDLTANDKMQLRDYMERCNVGYLKIEGNFMVIKQELIFYEVIYRRWSQIEALRQGMDEFGLYSYLCLNPSKENVTEVFPASKELTILPHMVLTKMRLEGDGGDPWEYFKNVVQEIHKGNMDDITLNTLLLFWTGQPILPSTDLTAEVDPEPTMPRAMTCFYRLFIPGGCANYEEFKAAFHSALKYGAKGFGEM